MKKNIKISIVVPVYNTADYLHQCIESLIDQTYSNIEIILVDDGSTDESGNICDLYAKKDRRIHVVHKSNGGVNSARKVGINIAEGQYIGFVDSDDWVDVDFLENIKNYTLNIFEQNNPDIIGFGAIEEYIDKSVCITNHIENGLYCGRNFEALKHNVLMTDVFFEWKVLPHLCDKLIKTEVLKKVYSDIDDCITFGEDATTVFACLIIADSFLSLDYTPYHYRQRDGSIVKSIKEIDVKNYSSIYRILKKYFEGYAELIDQLKYYLFFILLLKCYSNLNYEMILFPFCCVKPKNKILVYGAGGFGKVINTYIKRNSDLMLVGWTDVNCKNLQNQGLPVDDISIIDITDYDYIVISILNETVAENVKQYLIKKNIPEDKVLYCSKELLSHFDLPKWIMEFHNGDSL